MSKVICDICGTSYPESSTQCPICGCVRPAESPVIEDAEHDSAGYTYVKGGRFSKSNVRKRNQGNNAPVETEKKQANKKVVGFIIVLACLITIVGLMIMYILSGWFNQQSSNPNDDQPSETVAVSCTGLSLSKLEIEMTSIGEIWLLEAKALPVDTTDKITFTSSNEEVATVSGAGKITCVGEGQAVITVSCGDQTAECKVSCAVPVTTEAPTVPPEGVRLNRKSITADYEGFTWILYSGKVPVEDIQWTSDDPSVATIQDGIVTAVAEGQTMVHAEYNGVVSSCEILCDFAEATLPEGGGEDAGQTGSNGEEETYKLYSQFGDPIAFDEYRKAYDITAAVGDTIGLYLKNESGDTLALTWTITEGDSCTVEENYFTVNSSATNCMLEAEHEGIIYSCYVRTVN